MHQGITPPESLKFGIGACAQGEGNHFIVVHDVGQEVVEAARAALQAVGEYGACDSWVVFPTCAFYLFIRAHQT